MKITEWTFSHGNHTLLAQDKPYIHDLVLTLHTDAGKWITYLRLDQRIADDYGLMPLVDEVRWLVHIALEELAAELTNPATEPGPTHR